jgi:hypothetical protein
MAGTISDPYRAGTQMVTAVGVFSKHPRRRQFVADIAVAIDQMRPIG